MTFTHTEPHAVHAQELDAALAPMAGLAAVVLAAVVACLTLWHHTLWLAVP
jgi:hypothetical protein